MTAYRDISASDERQYPLAMKRRSEFWLARTATGALCVAVGLFLIGAAYKFVTGSFYDAPILVSLALLAPLVLFRTRLRAAGARCRASATASGAHLETFVDSVDPHQLRFAWDDVLDVDISRSSVSWFGVVMPFVRSWLRVHTKSGWQSISLGAFGCNEAMLVRRILRARSQGVESLVPTAEMVAFQRRRFAKPRVLRGGDWRSPDITLTQAGISIGLRRIDWSNVVASHVVPIPPLSWGRTRVHLELADGDAVVLRVGYDSGVDRIEELIAPQYCARDSTILTPSVAARVEPLPALSAEDEVARLSIEQAPATPSVDRGRARSL